MITYRHQWFFINITILSVKIFPYPAVSKCENRYLERKAHVIFRIFIFQDIFIEKNGYVFERLRFSWLIFRWKTKGFFSYILVWWSKIWLFFVQYWNIFCRTGIFCTISCFRDKKNNPSGTVVLFRTSLFNYVFSCKIACIHLISKSTYQPFGLFFVFYKAHSCSKVSSKFQIGNGGAVQN